MRPLLTKDSPWLFVGRWGRQLTRQRLWQMVRGRSQGVGRNVSPHMFRHSCATHMIENGADLRTVQTILGHADISNTQIYTNVSQGWVRKVYRKHHPRARDKARQLSLPIEDGRAAPQIGPTLCAHCMAPVCSESKWYCTKDSPAGALKGFLEAHPRAPEGRTRNKKGWEHSSQPEACRLKSFLLQLRCFLGSLNLR